MFDSILNGGDGPRSHFGVGAIGSIFVHGSLIAIGFYFATRPQEEKQVEAEVKFFATTSVTPVAPPSAPLAARRLKAVKTEKKILKAAERTVRPPEIPQEKPEEVEPSPVEDKPASAQPEVEGG